MSVNFQKKISPVQYSTMLNVSPTMPVKREKMMALREIRESIFTLFLETTTHYILPFCYVLFIIIYFSVYTFL